MRPTIGHLSSFFPQFFSKTDPTQVSLGSVSQFAREEPAFMQMETRSRKNPSFACHPRAMTLNIKRKMSLTRACREEKTCEGRRNWPEGENVHGRGECSSPFLPASTLPKPSSPPRDLLGHLAVVQEKSLVESSLLSLRTEL